MMMITLDDRRRVLELEVYGAYDIARISEVAAAIARLAADDAPWGLLERHHGKPQNLFDFLSAIASAAGSLPERQDPLYRLARLALVCDDPHWLQRILYGPFRTKGRRARIFRSDEIDAARAFAADFSGS